VTEEPVVDVENGETVETQSVSTRAQPGRHGNVTLAGQKISNADRVIDNVTGLKKIDLVRYYDEVAEWALPYLQGRPVSLVRAPNGFQGELFFLKHEERMHIPGITKLPAALHPKHPPLLVGDTHEALIGLAQMNVIVMSVRGCPYAGLTTSTVARSEPNHCEAIGSHRERRPTLASLRVAQSTVRQSTTKLVIWLTQIATLADSMH
jgi:hypothetical protein